MTDENGAQPMIQTMTAAVCPGCDQIHRTREMLVTVTAHGHERVKRRGVACPITGESYVIPEAKIVKLP